MPKEYPFPIPDAIANELSCKEFDPDRREDSPPAWRRYHYDFGRGDKLSGSLEFLSMFRFWWVQLSECREVLQGAVVKASDLLGEHASRTEGVSQQEQHEIFHVQGTISLSVKYLDRLVEDGAELFTWADATWYHDPVIQWVIEQRIKKSCQECAEECAEDTEEKPSETQEYATEGQAKGLGIPDDILARLTGKDGGAAYCSQENPDGSEPVHLDAIHRWAGDIRNVVAILGCYAAGMKVQGSQHAEDIQRYAELLDSAVKTLTTMVHEASPSFPAEADAQDTASAPLEPACSSDSVPMTTETAIEPEKGNGGADPYTQLADAIVKERKATEDALRQ